MIRLLMLAALWLPGLAPAAAPACDPDNGGLSLPEGFCAWVVYPGSGTVRHMVVRDNGDVYLMGGRHQLALRDADGDGRTEQDRRFGDIQGTGIALHRDWLYVSSTDAVYRYRLTPGELLPRGGPEPVIEGFPEQRSHRAKSFAIGDGALYVNVGAPSNACQKEARTEGSPGLDPCPQLRSQAGIWRFDVDRAGQRFDRDGRRFATGIRNAVALDWHPRLRQLFVVQHGRDQLHQLFPKLFSEEQSAELPAEELLRVEAGDDFGWPYCYYDPFKRRKVLAPEYGGDGERVGRCQQAKAPERGFPAHWAPNDLMFYSGKQFPARYRDGAFIAFHGSWNRAPLPQRGYRVVFQPFDGRGPSGDWETFADGFAGSETLASPRDARYRPMALAQAPDGSLYIADSRQGRLWRVVYRGSKAAD